MASLEAIYPKLPTFLQHVACSLAGWRIEQTRFRDEFLRLLHEAECRTFWPAERLNAYRDERLRSFVRHCAETVPFYRRRFREIDLSPDDIQTIQDLKRLPILTKREVHEHYDELLSSAIPPQQRIVSHTSGTTGGGLRFATTRQAIHEQWATWWRYRRWHGIEPGTWCGYFGGRSVVPSQRAAPFWRYNYPGRQILFSAYHMSPQNLAAYADVLRRRQPPWLHGYPSLLALLAMHIVESRVELGYTVRWVTAAAENLLPHQVGIIQRAFGVVPIQHYGVAEAVANVSMCERGRLHVDEDFSTVEFVPGPPGGPCRVIGTNVSNLATPLLRYDVQDLAFLSGNECPCGRAGRTVTNIDGRLEDYVILRTGAKLGRLDHIFKDLTNIREAQIVQKRVGEMIVRVVRGDHYSYRDEAALLRQIHGRVGDQAEVTLEYVNSVERSRTGKLRFVISSLPEGQLRRGDL